MLAAFPSAFGSKAELVGNPVRQNITQLPTPELRYASHSGKLKLLVVGGSLGAAALNDVLPKALADLPETMRPEVVHQAGEKHIASLRENYKNAGVHADARAFINNMSEL